MHEDTAKHVRVCSVPSDRNVASAKPQASALVPSVLPRCLCGSFLCCEPYLHTAFEVIIFRK